jgi:enoyl-CoA hydratase
MPETGIGLFPDVGGSRYLSRLPGRIGQFLALTGARFDGAECLWAGLGTHYLPLAELEDAKARIFAHPDRIAGILAELSVTPPPARIAQNAALVAHHFASDTYEDIVASLEADDSTWAAKELATLRSKSPKSSKVALRQLALGAGMEDFAEVMRMEYRLVCRLLVQPDFAEGVRAVITDKTGDPKWVPDAPEKVTPAMLDAIFAPLPADQEWTAYGQ